MDKMSSPWPQGFLKWPYSYDLGDSPPIDQAKGRRMSTSNPLAAKDEHTVTPPVPAPPVGPLARPSTVQQTSRSSRREHEVQRLIRDLAVLADNHRAQVS
ncbi:hypothetical protein NicSoilB11_18560 [Arthrobacter sp. NicSoilB11]|nr:hypothetical protein NicSoilB11_18560 [Arthrobacter sp. NicSoilB11]